MKFFKIIFAVLMLTSVQSFGQEDVQIPNIITPNGDSVNDIFSIRTSNFEQLTCTIFNRHGSPVFRYFGLNGTWDGYTHAGVKVSPGTYFVFVELTNSEGVVETRQGTLFVQYEKESN